MADVSPRCRHFGRCGGCQWQHLPYPAQLERKRTALAERLRASAPSAALPEVEAVIPMPVDADGMPWAFRHKAAFVFGEDGRGRLVMGHYAAGSREVVPVEECPVHGARANRIAFALRDVLAGTRVTAAGPRLDGVLRHLIVRTSADDHDAVAMLVVTRNAGELRVPIRKHLASADRPDGFFVNVHPTPSPYMVGRETLRIDGHAQVRERSLGLTFLVSPTAFFQTNPTAAGELARLVVEDVGPERRRVLDLYAGSGLFSLPLAARGHTVVAVEENASAVADAGKNLDVNRLDPRAVRLVRARAEDAVRDLERQAFDHVVLDPPRQGCAPAVLDGVFRGVRPPRATYVSCDADALAAQLPAILQAGYRVTRIAPVDMFPHTPHIEAVVSLERVSRGGADRRPEDTRVASTRGAGPRKGAKMAGR